MGRGDRVEEVALAAALAESAATAVEAAEEQERVMAAPAAASVTGDQEALPYPDAECAEMALLLKEALPYSDAECKEMALLFPHWHVPVPVPVLPVAVRPAAGPRQPKVPKGCCKMCGHARVKYSCKGKSGWSPMYCGCPEPARLVAVRLVITTWRGCNYNFAMKIAMTAWHPSLRRSSRPCRKARTAPGAQALGTPAETEKRKEKNTRRQKEKRVRPAVSFISITIGPWRGRAGLRVCARAVKPKCSNYCLAPSITTRWRRRARGSWTICATSPPACATGACVLWRALAWRLRWCHARLRTRRA